jgi:hypothetical protein
VEKTHKIIALITKIQINHKHNNKPNQASKVHTSSINSTCGTIVLFLLRAKILKLIFQGHKKVVRKGSNSIPNQGVKVRASTLKISNKVEK